MTQTFSPLQSQARFNPLCYYLPFTIIVIYSIVCMCCLSWPIYWTFSAITKSNLYHWLLFIPYYLITWNYIFSTAVSVLCGRSKKLLRMSPQCSFLSYRGLLKVLELLFFITMNSAYVPLGGVRYLSFPRCRMNQLNKTNSGNLIINFSFTSFDGHVIMFRSSYDPITWN